jgi:hypothetical protein
MPHRMLRVFINVFDENVFKNPLILRQPVRFSPEHPTLVFGKYFHLPVSVNFGKWILFTGKLPVN